MNTTHNTMTVKIKMMNNTVIVNDVNVSILKINIVQNNKRILNYCFG